MWAECKVLYAPFRAKMDWNYFKDYAKTPGGTKDIKDVSDNRKGSTMDFPGVVCGFLRTLRSSQKLFGTPMSNRLPRAPSFLGAKRVSQ